MHITCKLITFLILFGTTPTVWPTTYPGMGGAFFEDGIPLENKKLIPGSVTVVYIGKAYSMSTIDSTSYAKQSMQWGEVRLLRYIIQNQGNVADSISFDGRLIKKGALLPEVYFVNSDTQRMGTVSDQGDFINYGVWLARSEIETVFVKLSYPIRTRQYADSVLFILDIKNQLGTGGGSDSTDNWPGNRVVYDDRALFIHSDMQLTDKTSLTNSQDWMVDYVTIKVDGDDIQTKSDDKSVKRFVELPEGRGKQVSIDLVSSVPNPFELHTNINFSLSLSAYVIITIYEASGRKVTIVFSGSKKAGKHNVVWSGKDEMHNSVTDGIYFIEIRADGILKRSKLILFSTIN